MTYSETRIVIGGLAHIPILIFIANFIKKKFGVTSVEANKTVVKEEPVKVIEVKETVANKEKAKALKELSNKLDNIEERADEVYEKVKKTKKGKKKKKRKIWKEINWSWGCEIKNTLVKEGKARTLKELSNKLDNIEQKADEVYEKVKKKKKDKKKKKKNN